VKYQVNVIQAATAHPMGEGEAHFPVTVEEVKENIHAVYMTAQEWGGKVVAGYTVRCEPHEGIGDEPSCRPPRTFYSSSWNCPTISSLVGILPPRHRPRKHNELSNADAMP
jgi:hypothetical protein